MPEQNVKAVPYIICFISSGLSIYVLYALWTSYNNLIECESKESFTCPLFTCPGEDQKPTHGETD